MGEHLNESKLGEFLKSTFKGEVLISNKKVKESTLSCRPDFRLPKLKLIVEFDGFRHYNETKTILKDREKDVEYISMGYTIIRIPYFVQLSNDVIVDLFKVEPNCVQKFPHGFIDDKALLPVDFNELGLERFERDLNRFYYIKGDILKSIVDKITKFGVDAVLPKCLRYLMENP